MTYTFDLTTGEGDKIFDAAWADSGGESLCKTEWKSLGWTVYRGTQGEVTPYYGPGLRQHLVVFNPEQVHPSTRDGWLRLIGRIPKRTNHYPCVDE